MKDNDNTLETSACVVDDLRVFSVLSQEGYLTSHCHGKLVSLKKNSMTVAFPSHSIFCQWVKFSLV